MSLPNTFEKRACATPSGSTMFVTTGSDTSAHAHVNAPAMAAAAAKIIAFALFIAPAPIFTE